MRWLIDLRFKKGKKNEKYLTSSDAKSQKLFKYIIMKANYLQSIRLVDVDNWA